MSCVYTKIISNELSISEKKTFILLILSIFFLATPILSATLFHGTPSSSAADSNTTLIGEWRSGECWSVRISNNVAYIYKQEGSYPRESHYLVTVDISNHSNPYELANIAVPSFINDFKIRSDYGYVAVGPSGLLIIDFSDPTEPTISGIFDTDGNANGVAVEGDFAYVADDTAGLRIINIENPANPYEVGFYNSEGPIYDVEIKGDYAYIIGNGLAFTVINITNPTNPFKTGTIFIGGNNLALYNDYAYLASGNSLRVVNISNPNSPIEVRNLDQTRMIREINISGSYAYVANDYSGLKIYDLTNPASPQKKGTFGANSIVYGVAVDGNYAYVANAKDNLRIADISDPNNPINTLVWFNTDLSLTAITVDGDYAYTGAAIFDVSNSTRPIQKDFWGADNYSTNVAVSGNYAYRVGGYGLQVVDISDPSNTIIIGTLITYGGSRDVKVSGNYVYSADLVGSTFGLRIIDVSDPSAPTEVGLFGQVSANRVAVSGNYAFMIDGAGNSLRIIDVSNPANPIQKSFYQNNKIASDVDVRGGYAYVTYYNNGLVILDVSNASNPYEIGSLDLDGSAVSVKVDDNYAYIAAGYAGLQIVDISDPTNPQKAGYFDADNDGTIYYALDAAVSGNIIYLAYSNFGLAIIRNDLIVDVENNLNPFVENFKLQQNYPNPFNPSTKIKYQLPYTEFVTLKIYDVLGNEIATLVNGEKPAGSYEVNFNSTNFSSGVYFYKLQTGSFVETKKMILLR